MTFLTSKNFIIFAFFAVLLSGCGTFPGTPEILIQNAKEGGILSEKETYEVKRPIAEVTEVFKKKSHECLKQTITSSWWQGDETSPDTRVYAQGNRR